jgi:hypothetical protein
MGGRLFSQRAKRPLVPVVGRPAVEGRGGGRCEKENPGMTAGGPASPP